MADGVLDVHDRQVLDEARRNLRLSESEAAGLEQATIAGLTAEVPSTARHAMPIRLEVNANRFYMENHAGVLDFRLSNRTGKPVGNVRLSVGGNFLGASPEGRVDLPADGRSVRCPLQVLPSISGEHVVHVALSCEIDGQAAVFAADRVQPVLQQDATPASLTFVIDQRMQAGRNIGYGMSVRNEVKEGVASGIIRTANDLLSRKFADCWEEVALAFSDELTRAASERSDTPVRVVGPADDIARPVDRLSLLVGGPSAAARVLLLGSQRVRMGRGRTGNDIVLRLLPRSEANDKRSIQISGQHVVLSLAPGGLAVADRDTLNGTQADGKLVKGRVVVPVDRPCELDVGKALRLRLVPFLDSDDEAAGPPGRYAPLGEVDELWRTAEKLRLRSLLIERADNLAAEERYLVVYRWACVGRGAGNEIILPGACHDRRCMRIIRLGGRFWLEGLTDRECLSANGSVIQRDTARPLTEGLTVECSEARLTVVPFAQHGL